MHARCHTAFILQSSLRAHTQNSFFHDDPPACRLCGPCMEPAAPVQGACDFRVHRGPWRGAAGAAERLFALDLRGRCAAGAICRSGLVSPAARGQLCRLCRSAVAARCNPMFRSAAARSSRRWCLLNGLRMDDPETSHFNLDLPIPLWRHRRASMYCMERVRRSTVPMRLGGVINVRTATPTITGLRLSSGAGSYGINTQAAELSGLGRRWSVLAAGSRDFSSGFMEDRDYRSEAVSVEPRLQSRLGVTDVLAGRQRPGIRREPVLRQLPLVRAHQGLVCGADAAAGRTNRGFGRLSPAHR